MTTALIIAAFLAGFGAAKVKLHRGPVNIVRGLLLPHPSDERWEWRFAVNCYHANCWKIGEVEVCPRGHGVHVGTVPISFTRRYTHAVSFAQTERKALAAALGEP